MGYEVKIIRKNEHKTSEWSGGTTTELCIYPDTSVYKKLDFMWRISSAMVNVDESEFTHLPGIDRKIMIIDGELTLEHKGQYTTNLKMFDKDSFSGDWTTKSYGKVTDFNLMMCNGCSGDLEYIKIDKVCLKNIEIEDKGKCNDYIADVLYCVDGEVSIEFDNECNLYEGDLFVIIMDKTDKIKNLSIINKLENTSQLIRSRIYF